MASQSNAPFLIEHRSDDVLRAALEIAFEKEEASHWKIDPKDGLVFLWHGDNDAAPLPGKMGAEQAFVLARTWLRAEPMPKKPDLDGSLQRGFRVHRDYWGHAGGSFYAIIAVAPCWAQFGK